MHLSNNAEFTLHYHALTAFTQARDIASLMCDLRLRDNNDPRSAILYGALVGYYARPFLRSNILHKLPSDVVPDGYEKHHKKLLRHRNQVFLHTDPNAAEGENKHINHLSFTILPDKDTLCIHNTVPIPNAQTFQDICRLLELLIGTMNSALRDYIVQKVPDVPLIPGTYAIDLRGDRFQLKTET